MKIKKIHILIVSTLCGLFPAGADVITLSNGEVINGRVLRETDEEMVIEIDVTETIRDEKTFPKSEIKSIEKISADIKAFDKIKGLVPAPELLTAEDYDLRITAIEKFIEAHPKSGKIAKAKQMLDVLNEERAVVRKGGVKYGEEMISAEDYKGNAYEIDTRIAESGIREAVSRRDFISALRGFTAYEERFGAAEGREELIPVILQVLKVYGNTLGSTIDSLERRTGKRTSGLESMAPEDRQKTERAIADEQARLDARFAQEKAEKQAWVTPDAYHKDSLDSAMKQTEATMKRLEGGKGPRKAGDEPLAEVYRVAYGQLGGGDETEKKKVLADAKQKGLPDEYIGMLEERAGL